MLKKLLLIICLLPSCFLFGQGIKIEIYNDSIIINSKLMSRYEQYYASCFEEKLPDADFKKIKSPLKGSLKSFYSEKYGLEYVVYNKKSLNILSFHVYFTTFCNRDYNYIVKFKPKVWIENVGYIDENFEEKKTLELNQVVIDIYTKNNSIQFIRITPHSPNIPISSNPVPLYHGDKNSCAPKRKKLK